MTPLFDTLYSSPLSSAVTVIALSIILPLSRSGNGRQAILLLSLLLYVRYMVWRGLYTLSTTDIASTVASWVVYLAEVYGLLQFLFFSYQAWAPTDRRSPPVRRFPTVDILVTVVNEPLYILKRTLVGCVEQDYPRDKFVVYVLDDGHRDEVKMLAESLGCTYLRRYDRPRHAKAGNLNHALGLSSGELVAVFDVDHVPVKTFLRETVGFFEDEQVAFVQTAQHFYNPDIFQRNLSVERLIKNEQELFFRTLQAGRDRHNSAFFAGSGGLFRRRHLEEIHGFQTDTITEDIHTSLLLHAKGYKSCYLNKPLSAGLMPETFEGYIRQRTRWAIGSFQLFFKDNPLIKPGLTIPQRIHYLGSIYYFLHGFPRIICLVAPLLTLLLDVAPVHAEALTFAHLFGAYYAASVIALKPISGGTRNAFWSEIYEVAMYFALSWVAIKTFLAPFKQRLFAVTPKGQKIDQHRLWRTALVMPHLLVLGLLIVSTAKGFREWLTSTVTPGLEVSLYWACANLFLISIAILAARDRPQRRNALRLRQRFPVELQTESTVVNGTTFDLTEQGVAVELSAPVPPAPDVVLVTLFPPSGKDITLHGRITRQDRKSDRCVEVGIQYLDVDDETVRALIIGAFSLPNSWATAEAWSPGVLHSLYSLLTAFRQISPQTQPRRRRAPRVALQKDCRLLWQGQEMFGTTQDVSYTGLSIRLPIPLTLSHNCGTVLIENIVLKVAAISATRQGKETIVRFRVEAIEHGEEHWRELHWSLWRLCS
ncbi:MAG TPA: glycosyltransferase [Nitrospiraceae bacterium]|nr:glycosyltransferase [Nitrospiraceae bacterium]